MPDTVAFGHPVVLVAKERKCERLLSIRFLVEASADSEHRWKEGTKERDARAHSDYESQASDGRTDGIAGRTKSPCCEGSS